MDGFGKCHPTTNGLPRMKKGPVGYTGYWKLVTRVVHVEHQAGTSVLRMDVGCTCATYVHWRVVLATYMKTTVLIDV